VSTTRTEHDLATAIDRERADRADRFYWDPTARWMIAGFEALVVLVIIFAVATASASTTWWIVVPALIAAPVAMGYLALQTARSGVRETQQGLSARSGKYRSDLRWQDIVSFRYARLGVREIVVVQLVDGSGAALYGSRHRMRWAGGGATDDFATLLAARAGARGVTIEAPPVER
jgi:hypothetical protein